MTTKMSDLVIRKDWQSSDLARVVAFVSRNPGQKVIEDFEEILGVKDNLDSLHTLHFPSGEIAGVFLVDSYQNYWFDVDQTVDVVDFLRLTLPIAFHQSESRFEEPGLDVCEKANSMRISALEQVGFEPSGIQTKKYMLETDGWRNRWPIPAGLVVRPVKGEEELSALTELHRRSFQSDDMTDEYRLSMMRVPEYIPELDLVMEDFNHGLIAFCVCGLEEGMDDVVGYTDPVGVVPEWHGKGVGKAILAAGVERLQKRGVMRIGLGTSSENISMQKLAEAVGFHLIEEKIWLHLGDLSKIS